MLFGMLVVSAAVLFAPPPAMLATDADGAPGPIEFNQDLLERSWQLGDAGKERRAKIAAALRPTTSEQRAGLRVPVDFDKPESILRYVLSTVGACGTVYPTERYFYYAFDLGPRHVRGNIRFTDIEKRLVHVGYFDDYVSPGEIRARTFETGGNIEVTYDESTAVAVITIDGVPTAFELDRTMTLKPPPAPLQPGEEVVTGVLDESGYSFHLIFYKPESMFYYVLDSTRPVPELRCDMPTHTGLTLKVGVQSRFAFFTEPSGREILVGVLTDNIKRNSYFDGPFDQVPPNLPLRDRLAAAYPYVLMGGGIDEHGNFIGQGSQRVAISPYQTYDSLSKLGVDLYALYRPFKSGVERWSMLTYEWKRDFHKRLRNTAAPGPTGTHEMERSRAWPANHWGEPSALWPADHNADASAGLAPNAPPPGGIAPGPLPPQEPGAPADR